MILKDIGLQIYFYENCNIYVNQSPQCAETQGAQEALYHSHHCSNPYFVKKYFKTYVGTALGTAGYLKEFFLKKMVFAFRQK